MSESQNPEGFTEWKNDTSTPVEMNIFQGPPVQRGGKTVSGGFKKVRLEPGKSVLLPSEYDEAIQTTENGRVVAGLAPQLTKNGVHQAIHPALDVEGQKKKELEEAAARAALDKESADDAALIAQSRLKRAKEKEAAAAADPEPEPTKPEKKKG